jgi:pilus assembly protein CpaC
MRGKWFLPVIWLLLGFTPVIQGADLGHSLALSVGDSEIIKAPKLSRVSVGNPEVVEVVVTGSREVLLNAKRAGATVVNIWSGREIAAYRITVQENYSQVERELTRLIDNSQVEVAVNSKYVVLNGAVENSLIADQAVAYAKMYRENVINNLAVKTKYQILLSIVVTEVKKEHENKYGLRWGAWETTSDGVVFNEWQGATVADSKKFLSRYPGNWGLGAMLDAMEDDGDAKVLAAPSILTSNGQEATFLAGGEIPIPIPDGDQVKVDWKEYGVKLKVKPVLNRDLTMTLTVAPEVSSLDWSNAISLDGYKLPAVATRKASTQLEIKAGSTLVIGGLLKKEDSQSVVKVPFLGNLPIIGHLFRSNDFQKGQTELLFFVTPTLVREAAELKPEQIIGAPDVGPHFPAGPEPGKEP